MYEYLTYAVLDTARCSLVAAVELVNKNTLITSDMVDKTSDCISSNTPFTLSAKPGQTLNISLIKLNSNRDQMPYGKVKDMETGNTITLRNDQRTSHVMISSSNQVEITFFSSSNHVALDITGIITNFCSYLLFQNLIHKCLNIK